MTREEKIQYVKPAILDLGPVTTAQGGFCNPGSLNTNGDCETGGVAHGGGCAVGAEAGGGCATGGDPRY